jgi:hypothetical protein
VMPAELVEPPLMVWIVQATGPAWCRISAHSIRE